MNADLVVSGIASCCGYFDQGEPCNWNAAYYHLYDYERPLREDWRDDGKPPASGGVREPRRPSPSHDSGGVRA